MANKKINKQKSAAIEQQTTVANLQDGIRYTGKVRIIVKQGKYIINKREYHNAGCGPLFKFVGLCLAGNYDYAKQMQPNSIILWYNKATEVPEGKPDFDNCEQASAKITFDTTPTILPISTSDADAGYKTILHFSIPYSYFKSGIAGINQLCLYSGSGASNDPSAIYYLVNDADPTAWNPLTIPETTNYLLIVEWELSVQNAA